jgi:hypothetical protein
MDEGFAEIAKACGFTVNYGEEIEKIESTVFGSLHKTYLVGGRTVTLVLCGHGLEFRFQGEDKEIVMARAMAVMVG